MSILFVNASPNPRGTTARLAALYRMRYEGMASNATAVKALARRV